MIIVLVNFGMAECSQIHILLGGSVLQGKREIRIWVADETSSLILTVLETVCGLKVSGSHLGLDTAQWESLPCDLEYTT